ncbi:hypothetical protein N5P37_001016, partial [Trichoderma harzianum]
MIFLRNVVASMADSLNQVRFRIGQLEEVNNGMAVVGCASIQQRVQCSSSPARTGAAGLSSKASEEVVSLVHAKQPVLDSRTRSPFDRMSVLVVIDGPQNLAGAPKLELFTLLHWYLLSTGLQVILPACRAPGSFQALQASELRRMSIQSVQSIGSHMSEPECTDLAISFTPQTSNPRKERHWPAAALLQ